jgi:hypothetical protein
MWDSVIIGSGSKGNSAIKVLSLKGDHSISENSVSYWISDLYLGLGMTIFKDTDAGKKLSRLIEENVPLEDINTYLDGILLQNINRGDLKAAIDKAIRKSFRDGLDAKASEIRCALGL